MNPLLTPGIDVALLVFWAFVLFFIGLVFYLRREDRREGYPVENELTGRIDTPGGPLYLPAPKTFKLPFGHGSVTVPRRNDVQPVDIAARRMERSGGSPYVPTGNPLVDGIGPAAWANRADVPDIDMHGHPRIIPLSMATGFSIAREDSDLHGWPVCGADGQVAGHVKDLWIDTADRLIRYIELDGTGGPQLAPMMMSKVHRKGRRVVVDALNAEQFAGVPRLAQTDRITMYEEERVQAYFGGGYLYANASRQEPLF